jgi:CHAD domain-containing protein
MHQIPASVETRQTVEDAFQRILRATRASVKEWEPTAIAGEDPEGVHQVRVGLRRMRSALGVFRPTIPPRSDAPAGKGYAMGRVDSKKLRYATEFYSPLYGKQIEMTSRRI